jgi:hypothetical protein
VGLEREVIFMSFEKEIDREIEEKEEKRKQILFSTQ